jgi:hypothetical protein
MQIHPVIRTAMPAKDSTLYSLVNDLIHEAAPLAVHNRNFVVNNIPADLCIETNNTMVFAVLNKLFHTVIRHAQNSVILISPRFMA